MAVRAQRCRSWPCLRQVRVALDPDFAANKIRVAHCAAGAAMNGADAIPVSVLTGFLGSGKTTMLGHLLRQPEFSHTAVIINEFGEIGLDHELIETSEDSIVTLTTGCSAARSAPICRKHCKTCCVGAMKAHAPGSIGS